MMWWNDGRPPDRIGCSSKRNQRTQKRVCPPWHPFVAALSNWCKQQDLTVATTLSGHDSFALHNTIGYLTRLFMLRVSLSRQDTFLDVLRIVSNELLGAWEHLESGMVTDEYL